ncbi:hypothetical protein GCM10028827_12120 [Mucilaginibacter myungsuensis]
MQIHIPLRTGRKPGDKEEEKGKVTQHYDKVQYSKYTKFPPNFLQQLLKTNKLQPRAEL